MAKTISDEQMKLTMIINGDSAQKELFDLEKSTRSLNEQNKSLLLQKKLLEKQGQKDTEQYKLLTATMKQNTAELVTNKTRMAELQKEIGLTGLTMGQLQSKATMLRNTLRNLIPGSPDYLRFDAELTQVNNRLGELRGRAQTARSSVASLADGFNRYQALAVSFIAGLTGVIISIQNIISMNGKLSDAQSDVMKTTRMTKEEVDALTKSFGILKSRTQRIDLLGIAAVGGELNIAKSEILDFVKVMDKSGVALGDSFEGGAEEVATKLGKIKNLYKELKDARVELTFESVGSALNDLGADGNATAGNVAEFVTRVGTMPEAFKPSIAIALGLGAAFEETGLNAEKSATNYSKVITIAANNIEGFARVMGKPKKQMEDLMNTNPNEFFLQFSKSISNLKPVELANVLDSLKLNDNEVKQVISAAGNNVELFRQKIVLANQSLNEGTSLTDEYNIKNNNLAATLEKISKRVSGWFSSESFNNWLFSMVEGFGRLIGATDDVDGAGQKWRNTLVFIAKVIAIVTAALITNVGWQKLVALWTTRNTEATLLYTIASKARAFADGVGMIASQAFAGVMMLLRGNVVGATQAFRVMTTAMMTTPWGFILGAIAAIGTAYIMFSDSAKEAASAQSMMAEIQIEVAKSISKEKKEVEALIKVINDETVSKDKKLAAVKRLNEISPEYLKGLTLENIKTFEGKKLLDRYIDSLYKKARATAVVNKMQQLEDKKLDAESKTAGDYRKESTFGFLGSSEMDGFTSRKDFENYVKGKFKGVTKENFNRIVNKYMSDFGFDEKEKNIKDINSQLNALKPEYEKNLVDSLVTKVDTTTPDDTSNDIPGANSASGTKRNPNSTPQEIARKNFEEATKNKEDLLNLDRQYQDDKLALMAEGAEKELLIEQQRYLREIDELEKKKVHSGELAKLNEDIAKAKESGDKTEQNRLEGLRKGWDAKNQIYDDRINVIKEGKLKLHNQRIGIIQEKAAKELLDKEHEDYERSKLNRETAFNNELNVLNVSDAEKKRLQDEHNNKELQFDKEYLSKKLDELNRILSGEVINGVDFSLLSPEAKQKIIKDTELVQNAFSKLKGEGTDDKKKPTDLGLGNTTDILGFSAADWFNTFNNLDTLEGKMKAMQMAVSALQQLFSQYDQFMTASENANLKRSETSANRKKTALKRQLDSGMISQTQYNKKVEKIDEDLDNKKSDLEYKQAKRQKMISAANIVMSTAQAIIGIWAQFPKADFGITAGIMSGVVGALGALQLATVMRTPLPAKGYESGLYPEYVKREQDGKMFKSRYQGKTRSGLVSNTSHFLVAENGPEMVIDNKAWTQMDPAVKDALVRDLRGIKGFEQGYYNQDLKRYEVPASSSAPASSNNDSQLLQMVLAVVAENTAVMKDLRDKGVVGKFFKNDLQSAKNIQDSISDFNDLRNKSKK